MGRKRKFTGSYKRKSPIAVLFGLALKIGLVLIIAVVGYVLWLDQDVRKRFDGSRWQIPARMYARPLDLYVGKSLTPVEFENELAAANYHREKFSRTGLSRAGSFYKLGAQDYELQTREFLFWDGDEKSKRIRVRFRDGVLQRIVELTMNKNGKLVQKNISLARIDPAIIGQIYPQQNEDRILVRLEEVSDHLIDGIIAVEDRNFYTHTGISPKGIARAFWANLRAQSFVQGGSTITQQLAKSYFLSQERTLWRKINDAIIAILLELHYTKDDLLQSYINEIYLGQLGSKSINGFGLAAWHYFGRRVDELSLSETALLVAIVRGPSSYNPRRNPGRALKRRNLVLQIMAKQNMISDDEATLAITKPLGIRNDAPPANSPYPEFLELVRLQLLRDYHSEDLQNEGLNIFTTLDPYLQNSAKKALNSQLQIFDKQANAKRHNLQGSVVVIQPHTGEILALVGGRGDWNFGFNRALNAKRPIGSLVKPIVFSAALEHPDNFSLLSKIDDSAIELVGKNGKIWKPQNYSKETHGEVPLIQALAKSYNLATIRLGQQVGFDNISKTLEKFGIQRDVEDYPSTLLGSLELSPLDVAKLYTPFASGGYATPPRVIRNVTSADGELLKRYELASKKVLNADTAFLTKWALQEVVLNGTAQSAKKVLSQPFGFAGKTGTTDDFRDSWFVGFGEDRLTTIWLGHDDFTDSGLSGASGALRVWMKLVNDVSDKPFKAIAPENISWVNTDMSSGNRVKKGCKTARVMPFIRGFEPVWGPCGPSWQQNKNFSNNTVTFSGGQN